MTPTIESQTVWFLVASRSGAKIYQSSRKGEYTLVDEESHPEGRLKGHEIDTDRTEGRFSKSEGDINGYQQPQIPEDRLAENFARLLMDKIDAAATSRRFDRFYLVAEARFLGKLRSKVPASLKNRLAGTLEKDLLNLSVQDLPRYFDVLIEDLYRSFLHDRSTA